MLQRGGEWLHGKPPLHLLFALADILAFNLILYELIRAIVLYPLKFYSLWEIALWALLFLGAVVSAQLVGLWGERNSWRQVSFQIASVGGFIAFVAVESNRVVTAKGLDFSWLRPEVIKVPYWTKLLAPLSPGYTALFFAGVVALVWTAHRTPRSPWLPLLPAMGALLLTWKIAQVFAPFIGWSVGGVGAPVRPQGTLVFYLIMFAGPAIAVVFLLWRRSFSLAFRLTPLAFQITLIALHYMGTLPVASIYDVFPVAVDPHIAVTRTPGVSVYYPPPGTKVDPSFLFLRKLLVAPRTMYLNYGPTCGLYAIDRRMRGARQIPIPGLMRDLQFAPGRDELWGLNWLDGDFLAIGAEPLAIRCRRDMFGDGLTTPYNMLVDGSRLFVSNVTLPIVAEFGWDNPADPCSLRLRRSLDLHASGFTKFTDGAFGMYLDRDTDRLYVSVGLVADRNLSAIAEIDLATFAVSRDVKLTAGNPIFRIAGRRSFWAPSYYNAEMHEVSLDTMKILRTIPAGPNLVSLVQDERRGLFYGLCRAPGTMQVIDDASGRIIKEVYVGAKPEPLWLDRENDRVYVASGVGILEIDLPVFLGERPPAVVDSPPAAPGPN